MKLKKGELWLKRKGTLKMSNNTRESPWGLQRLGHDRAAFTFTFFFFWNKDKTQLLEEE